MSSMAFPILKPIKSKKRLLNYPFIRDEKNTGSLAGILIALILIF